MGGFILSICVSVQNKRYQCTFELQHKISIVVGESGRGKTILVKALMDRSGVYKTTVSDKKFRIVVLSVRDYEAQLSFYRGIPCIFVVDDEDFMYTEYFARYIKEDTESYFMLICRLEPGAVSGGVLADIGFSAKAIYRFVADGVNHWLEPVYHFPEIREELLTPKLIDFCFIEDSTTEYKFFKRIFRNVKSTYGRTGILKCLKGNMEQVRGKVIFLIVDIADVGFFLKEAVEYCKLNGVKLYLFGIYESFEYMVLLSNMFGYDRSRLEQEGILKYNTLEQKCTDILSKITAEQPNKYGKKKECTCYYLDCCHVKRDGKCSFGLPGDKITAMLEGTPFHVLLRLRQV